MRDPKHISVLGTIQTIYCAIIAYVSNKLYKCDSAIEVGFRNCRYKKLERKKKKQIRVQQ